MILHGALVLFVIERDLGGLGESRLGSQSKAALKQVAENWEGALSEPGRERKVNRCASHSALLLVMLLGLPACSSNGDSNSEPTATYEGDGCTYDGPDEFDLGSEATFTLVDTVEDSGVGFGVWMLPQGMTAQEIRDRGILNRGAQIAESAAEITDSGIRLTFTFDTPGLYALNCAARPEGGPAVDYANLFIVNE